MQPNAAFKFASVRYIYSWATRVILWTGEEDSFTVRAFEIINKLALLYQDGSIQATEIDAAAPNGERSFSSEVTLRTSYPRSFSSIRIINSFLHRTRQQRTNLFVSPRKQNGRRFPISTAVRSSNGFELSWKCALRRASLLYAAPIRSTGPKLQTRQSFWTTKNGSRLRLKLAFWTKSSRMVTC
jgi:hypothetical protein